MKVDMSPKAIENRLKLVGQLTKACLMINRNSLGKGCKARKTEKFENNFSNQIEKKQP